MSADKWNQRFATASSPSNAAQVLQDHIHLLPPSGTALDFACGLGANALLLANQHLTTHAWDFSPVALEKLQSFATEQQLAIETRCIDLEASAHLPEDKFDIIVISNYLYRPIFPYLCERLNPDGLIFYETFTQHQRASGGPTNPDFLLERNELLVHFASLSLVYYREEHGCGDMTKGQRHKAYLIAQKKQKTAEK